MKTAIIFDLDGTLLDTLGDLHAATNHVLTQFGYPCRSIDEVCRFVGNGAAQLIRLAVPEGADSMVSVVTKGAQVYMPMGELVDFEKERERLNKEKAKVQKDIDFVSKKLNNPGFVAKAPEAVIAAEKEKLAKYEELMAKLDASLAALQ